MRTRLLGVALVATAGLLISTAASGSDATAPRRHDAGVRVHDRGTLTAPRSAAARAVTYGGLTSNGWPVMVEATASGRRINRAIAALESTCTPDGHTHVEKDRWTNVPVSARGRFSVKFNDAWAEEGIEAVESFSFSGTLSRRSQKVTGKWRYSGRYTTTSTGAVETCTTGPLTFSARR